MNLRPYQLRAIQEVLRVQDRRPVLVLPMGAGKTFTAAMLVRELHRPALWIAHRRELIQQAAERLQALGLRTGVIMASVPENRAAQVQVASIQTLARRTCPPAGLVIVDECFPAGTLVETVSGPKPIETITAGELVRVYQDGLPSWERVQSTFKQQAPSPLCRIQAGGHSVVCTLNHPFLTESGHYVPAEELQAGDQVVVSGGADFSIARVDCIESGPEGLCPDGHVYNLEVSGPHNYLANGFVVHNCHHARSASYEKVLGQYPSAMILGLTATPFRLDGKGLGDVFHELVAAAYPDELCADGTLMAPAVYAPPAPDLRDVHITHGDFSGKDLSRVMDKPRLVGDILATWRRLARGRRTVVFAVDVEHSRHLIEGFHKAGVSAAHLDGSSSRLEREAVLAAWRTGRLTVVSNCELFGEGFDLPALECAVLARPTASLCLHLQQIGRVMRSAEGKDEPIVLDHAGNHHRHGRVTDRIEYNLTGPVSRPADREGLATFKQCRSCFLICSLSAKVCPGCGAAFVSQREVVQEQGELVRLEAARRNAPFSEKEDFWRIVEDQRNAYGYRVGWSEHRFRARFGDWPTLAGRDLVDLGAPTEEQKKKVYLELLGLCRRRGWKDGRAYHMYVAKFGEKPPYRWRLERSA